MARRKFSLYVTPLSPSSSNLNDSIFGQVACTRVAGIEVRQVCPLTYRNTSKSSLHKNNIVSCQPQLYIHDLICYNAAEKHFLLLIKSQVDFFSFSTNLLITQTRVTIYTSLKSVNTVRPFEFEPYIGGILYEFKR